MPDFVIFGVSGHHMGETPAGDLWHNPEYLAARGTLDAVAQPLVDAGYSALGFGYGDEFWDHTTESGAIVTLGFLSLLEDLEFVETEWIYRRDYLGNVVPYINAPRVIVVAHSHGAVWAHLALHVAEMSSSRLWVDILVDLDGESLGWEFPTAGIAGDHWKADILEWTEYYGWAWPLDIWNPSNGWTLSGVSGAQDIEDIVPYLVGWNLEVAGNGLIIQDGEPNHRWDGSIDGIYRAWFDEGHRRVTEPGSEAMDWVVEAIRFVYDL